MIREVLVHRITFVGGELHSPFHDTDAFPYLRNNGVFPLCYRRIRKLIKWMDDLLGAW